MVPAMLLTCSVTLGKAFTFSGPQFSYQLCASQNGESLVQVIFRAAQLGRGGAIPAQTSPLLVSGWRTPFPVLTLHQPIWGLFPVSYGHLMERLLGLSFSTATSPQYGNNCFSILVLGTLSFKIFCCPSRLCVPQRQCQLTEGMRFWVAQVSSTCSPLGHVLLPHC